MCDLHICRICINTAVNGYKFDKYRLGDYYEFVMRQKLSSKDTLPQWVCYECAMMLHKFHKFKEKCLHGQNVLKEISSRGRISYESVAMINRSTEKLISPVGIARSSKRVETTTLKYKPRWKHKLVKKSSKHNKDTTPVVRVEIKTENTTEVLQDNTDSQINADESTKNIAINLSNANIVSKTFQITVVQEEVKHETVNEITSTSTDPIKDEMAESYIEKDLTNIFNTNTQNTVNDKEKIDSTNIENSNLENAYYNSDINFEIDDEAVSSEDESLAVTMRKKSKVKRKQTHSKSEPKMKKRRSEVDNVELKNTKPKKHFLNPQFWKKISLSEEEAVREFKRREFDNDYYLKAKYKCQNCFKGFSKNDMLIRHLKHWHDESSGRVECRFCHMRFRHKHQLVRHMQEHLILHHCLQCNLQFPRLQAALAHQQHHNGIKRTCEHCGKEFNHLSTYYTHLRMSHKSSHVCVACGASFVSENGLHLHIKFKHFVELEELEEKMRQQKEASNKRNEQSEAQATEGTDSSNAEEIYCVKCDIKFMSRPAFNIHFFNSKNHDDEDAETDLNKIGAGPRPNSKPKIPTSCPHCHVDFPTRQGYIKHHKAEHAHIALNLPKKRDICEVCGASIQMGSIQYHMKSHTGERDFACPAPACGMRFTQKYNMKRHYNVKHLGIPAPKYVRRTPGRRKKKTQEILENDFSPFVRTRTGYFL